MYSLDKEGPVRFAQITDTHLEKSEKAKLLGLETLHSLECVLANVKESTGQFDFFLVTGDISQDGSVTSYQHLHNSLMPFKKPSFWLTGNHDSLNNMRQVCDGTEHLESIIRTKHWQIILLHSQVDGSVFGHLADDQFDLLSEALNQYPDLYTVVSLHHHPIPMGSAWIDKIGVKNGDKLMEFAQQYDKIKCILWGHVHQESDQVVDGIRMLSTPSTCVQFKPSSDDFDVDTRAPGYRFLELNPDGSIETEVSRVEGIKFDVDLTTKGY